VYIDFPKEKLIHQQSNYNLSLWGDKQKVYSRELLDKIEAARRRRPGVMAERNRWKRIKTRTAELDYVVEDDPEGGIETAEGKRFRLPEPSFWQK
jgi:hypothetical protein